MPSTHRSSTGASAPALVVMAKEPAVGQTKTRLCPPLTPSQAAELYAAMLSDTLRLVSSLANIAPAVAVTPPEAIHTFADLIHPTSSSDSAGASGARMRLMPVAGHDIGDCLDQVLTQLLAAGHPVAMALNSDGPTLPPAIIQRAVTSLATANVVLGPSEDGGYYLIGLKQPAPGLFKDIDWSTEQVTRQTLDRAQTLRLSVALLPPWYDVDTAADLTRLRAELDVLSDNDLPFTRRFFARHFPV